MKKMLVVLAGILWIGSAPSIGWAEEVDSHDIALQAAVDRALIADNTIPDHVIEVEAYPSRSGFVRLVGSVERTEQHQRVLATALGVPGIVGVIDNITIRDLVTVPDVAVPPRISQ